MAFMGFDHNLVKKRTDRGEAVRVRVDIGNNGSAYAVVSVGIRENVVNMVDGLLIVIQY